MPLLSMVAELWLMQLLVLTLCFLLSFLGNRSCQTLRLENMQELSGIQPSNNSGMDDLELRIWTLRFWVFRAQDCLPRDRCSVGTRHAFFLSF